MYTCRVRCEVHAHVCGAKVMVCQGTQLNGNEGSTFIRRD